MLTPVNSFTSPAPAPEVKAQSTSSKISYDEVVRYARMNVLEDFNRQQAYRNKKKLLHATGGIVTMIPIAEVDETQLTKGASHRLLKEHTSSSWSIFFFQWSLFGAFAVTTVTCGLSVYLTVCHNRMFFPFAPLSGMLAYKTWNMLENAWEQQRFIDNAAQIRTKRVGNPVNNIPKGKEKALEEPVDLD